MESQWVLISFLKWGNEGKKERSAHASALYWNAFCFWLLSAWGWFSLSTGCDSSLWWLFVAETQIHLIKFESSVFLWSSTDMQINFPLSLLWARNHFLFSPRLSCASLAVTVYLSPAFVTLYLVSVFLGHHSVAWRTCVFPFFQNRSLQD